MLEVKDIVYRTIFTHLDQVYTIYSQGVSEETLVGFIELDSILLVTQDIILSSENQTAHEPFMKQIESIKRTYVPMHAVVRIDEMTRKHFDYEVLDGDEKPMNVQHIRGGNYSSEEE
jgi:hypothetical protein